MKIQLRFGEYGIHPNKQDWTTYDFPDDSIFITGGTNDIGRGLHDGALHVLALVRCRSEEEFEKFVQQDEHHLEWVATGRFFDKPFEVNGYRFIELRDCLIDGVDFMDADKVVEALDLKNNQPYIYIYDKFDPGYTIFRMDRVESFYHIKGAAVYINGDCDTSLIMPCKEYVLDGLLSECAGSSISIEYGGNPAWVFSMAVKNCIDRIYPGGDSETKEVVQ